MLSFLLLRDFHNYSFCIGLTRYLKGCAELVTGISPCAPDALGTQFTGCYGQNYSGIRRIFMDVINYIFSMHIINNPLTPILRLFEGPDDNHQS